MDKNFDKIDTHGRSKEEIDKLNEDFRHTIENINNWKRTENNDIMNDIFELQRPIKERNVRNDRMSMITLIVAIMTLIVTFISVLLQLFN